MTDYSELKQSSMLGAGSDYLEKLYENSETQQNADNQKWSAYFDSLGPKNQAEEAISLVREQFTNKRGFTTPNEVNSSGLSKAISSSKQTAIANFINSYRSRGHEIAKIDPLNIRDYDFIIELSFEGHNLSKNNLQETFNGGSLFDNQKVTLQEIYNRLQKIYCGSIGYEYRHIGSTSKKEWLRKRIESDNGDWKIPPERKKWLLERISSAEGLEKYLHTQYVGQKRFSLEGGESLIPCLDTIIEAGGKQNLQEIVIGMAHRGRLNVLVNIFGKSPSVLFEEFEGKKNSDLISGDVKYHQGFSSDLQIDNQFLHLTLAFNPSHLEIVSPVVEGSVRARQDRRKDRNGSQVLPITIHGDASFAGQGVVMETLNMANSNGYNTRGTIHIVVNNQIGFTTSNALDARSTQYCTDVAKMLNIPIFHVNSDDPEAVYFVSKLAFEYRQKFNEDVIIDLYCYRRHGHNEADEPAVTQPNMYRIIRLMKTTRELYGKKLIEEKIINEKALQQIQQNYRNKLKQGDCVAPYITTEKIINEYLVDWSPYLNTDDDLDSIIDTKKGLKTLQQLGQKLSTIPDDFAVHSRAKNILKQRLEMAKEERPIDWGFAENLAYATLLDEGYSIRITGQDVRRGTFFHRHATYHNTEQRKSYTPLQKLKAKQPSFTIIDSMLSEEAVLAFEYGYASSSPETLVIWEAQFGDFANGAQVVIDQFISSGEVKWGRYCGLVMLLPHGFEGQGPEHSSARVERYFQLCAEGNMQLVVPSSPQQIYHLIRRQMLLRVRKPLVVMTPKSLLRLPEAVCNLKELSEGLFEPVIDDPNIKNPKKIKTILFCSGKIYYEILTKQKEHQLTNVALIRLERYYPFPYLEVLKIMEKYDQAKDFRWCQEEPKNQGAWRSISHRFNRVINKLNAKLEQITYFGRLSSASPAVGSLVIHNQQQNLIIEQALGLQKTTTAATRWRRLLGETPKTPANLDLSN